MYSHLRLLVLAAAMIAARQAATQTAPQSPQRKSLTPEEVIQAFAAKETQFFEAWMQYTYRQTADIRILSVDGYPSRERMTLVSDVVFKDDGTREVRLISRSGRLRSVGWTPEDETVLNDIQPFALTTKELPFYNLKYEGKEKVDELECYTFSVKPKSTRGNRLYFEGKIWVDDQDLQIVKTMGKPVPQKRENQFPAFETIRQMIDDKYWFPAWTHADSSLHFPAQVVRVEETITYDNYKRFGSKATVEFSVPKPEKP